MQKELGMSDINSFHASHKNFQQTVMLPEPSITPTTVKSLVAFYSTIVYKYKGFSYFIIN